MLAVHGIYDGKSVKITERISEKRKFKVVVTFIEELDSADEEIRDFTAQTSGLDILEDPREDIYQDYLSPKSDKKVKSGDIILIPFPFAELTNKKVRPAVVITETDDKFKDIVVSAISSVVPSKISKREIKIKPNNINNLRVESIIKVDRIVTLKKDDVIFELGKLSSNELDDFKRIFNELIE